MNGTKSVWASKTIWGGIVALVAAVVGMFGVDMSETVQEDLATQIIQIVNGMAFLVGTFFVFYGRIKADKRLGLWLMLVLPTLMLGACSASNQRVQPLDIDTTNTALSSTVIDQGEAGSLTSHAIQGQHFSTFGAEGMETFSPSPAGSYFIGQSGAAVSDPKDVRIDHIEMDFDVFVDPTTGVPVIFTKRVSADGINGSISEPIRAQAVQWESWLEALRHLAETDRAKFESIMETIEATAPDLFEVIKLALGLPG